MSTRYNSFQRGKRWNKKSVLYKRDSRRVNRVLRSGRKHRLGF